MGMELRVELAARVVVEARDDPVARRLDRGLAVLLDAGLGGGRFEVRAAVTASLCASRTRLSSPTRASNETDLGALNVRSQPG